MPEYIWACDDCDNAFVERRSIRDFIKRTVCPHCDGPNLYQEYGCLHVNVIKGDNEITLGQLADRNRERFSADKKYHLTQQHTKYLEDKQKQKKDLPSGMNYIERPKVKTKWTSETSVKRRSVKKRIHLK